MYVLCKGLDAIAVTREGRVDHAKAMPTMLDMEADKREQTLPEAVRTLVEARTGDAVYVVGNDYTIVHWDRRMESLSGMLSEEALGKPCYEAVMGEGENGHPFCAHGYSVMHLAQEGRPVSSYEMRIRTRAGRRWVSASNLTIETEEGPYLVHLLRDSQGMTPWRWPVGSYSSPPRRMTPHPGERTSQPSLRGN
jgi:PAS domain S-box-containing protein